MAVRVLTKEEEAIVDAIIDQRLKKFGNIFEYDFVKAQEFLSRNGVSAQYVISFYKQLEIIQRLATEKIINMDFIVDVEFINKVRSAMGPNTPPLKSDKRFYWLNNTDWAYETYQLNGLKSIEEACSDCGGKICINMTEGDIENINYAYKASHIIEAWIDKNNYCLCISFDHGEKHNFQSLDPDKAPLKILRYACYMCPNKEVNRKELHKRGIITEAASKKSLKTQVFSDNGPVKALNPLLIEIDNDKIIFRRSKNITLAELEGLKSKLRLN